MKTTVQASRRFLLSCLLAFGTALALPALAQKEKSTDLAGFPLWTAKKSPLAGPFVPGLNAALLCTDAQKQKLITAREEIYGDEKFQKLGAAVKQNASASEAQREAAREAADQARDQLKARIQATLTPEQRKLVERINTLFDEVLSATQESYAGQFTQLKKDDKARMAELRNEVREKGLKDFKLRLEGVLNAEQFAAFTKAAVAEESVAKSTVKVKKD